ncbi:hypothetical protein FOCC_FOCC001476 [Frankliniella occidentalis]|nr:hypothetical protein FOCC_FOCC001476 [Frankliniella occidentalis]
MQAATPPSAAPSFEETLDVPAAAMARTLALVLVVAGLAASVGGDHREQQQQQQGQQQGHDAAHSRQKRLLWVTNDGRLALPPGTALTITPTISMPFVRYPPDGFLSNMALLYAVVEDLLDNFGMDGKACLLRAICEVHGRSAESLRSLGVLGEMLRLFLTASKSPFAVLLPEYVQAERAGAGDGECWPYFRDCPKMVVLPKLVGQLSIGTRGEIIFPRHLSIFDIKTTRQFTRHALCLHLKTADRLYSFISLKKSISSLRMDRKSSTAMWSGPRPARWAGVSPLSDSNVLKTFDNSA